MLHFNCQHDTVVTLKARRSEGASGFMVAVGHGLYVAENPSGGTVQGTEYAANYRIDNGAVTMIHTDAGYYTPVTSQGGPGVSYSHVWYLKDHLGNNRVLAYGSGNAVALHDHESNGAFLKPHLRDWQ